MSVLYLNDPDQRLTLRDGRYWSGDASVPVEQVDAILVIGPCQVTTQVVQDILRRGGSICWTTSGLKLLGWTQSAPADHTALHLAQLQAHLDPERRLAFSRHLVDRKIASQIDVLSRYRSRHAGAPLTDVIETLRTLRHASSHASTLDSLRGYEGNASKAYFGGLSRLFDPHWQFVGRRQYPPADPINAFLSFGYMLLYHLIHVYGLACGLHPGIGLFHEPRDRHPALISDLIEGWRAIIVDRCTLDVFGHGRMTDEDFQPGADGRGIYLNPIGRKKAIGFMEKRLSTEARLDGRANPVTYRQAIETYVRSYAARLRETKSNEPGGDGDVGAQL